MSFIVRVGRMAAVAGGVLCVLVVAGSERPSIRVIPPNEAAQLFGGQQQDRACETQKQCESQIEKDCRNYLNKADCQGKQEDLRTSAGYACTKEAAGVCCSEIDLEQRVCLNTYNCLWNETDDECMNDGNALPNPPKGNGGCAVVPCPDDPD